MRLAPSPLSLFGYFFYLFIIVFQMALCNVWSLHFKQHITFFSFSLLHPNVRVRVKFCSFTQYNAVLSISNWSCIPKCHANQERKTWTLGIMYNHPLKMFQAICIFYKSFVKVHRMRLREAIVLHEIRKKCSLHKPIKATKHKCTVSQPECIHYPLAVCMHWKTS